MARASRVGSGEAADRLDRAVRDILCGLRQGKRPALPGLGRFVPGPGGIAFERGRESDHE